MRALAARWSIAASFRKLLGELPGDDLDDMDDVDDAGDDLDDQPAAPGESIVLRLCGRVMLLTGAGRASWGVAPACSWCSERLRRQGRRVRRELIDPCGADQHAAECHEQRRAWRRPGAGPLPVDL